MMRRVETRGAFRRPALRDPLPHARARILETRTGPRAALAVLAPLLWLVLVYIVLSLFDLWSRMPPLAHLLAFVCLVVAVLGGIGAAIGSWRHPRDAEPIRWSYHLVWLPVLMVGLFLAGGDWQRRMVMAFQPGLLFSPPDMKITAVITPPAYTGLAPLQLPVSGTRDSQQVRVPAGSLLRVEVQSSRWPPVLAWAQNNVVLRPQSDGSHAIDGELKADGRVRLAYAGKTLVRWTIDVVPDKAPTLKLVSKPAATVRQSLRLEIDAGDDHGIEFMALRLKRADGTGLDHVVELPAWGTPIIKETIFRDLTADPLAGQEVILQVVALDGLSQEALSEPVTVTLPKRSFKNPLSLSLVATRAGLLTGEDDDVEQGVRRLRMLTEQPPVVSDATVHLGLRSAYLRLKSSYDHEEREEVADLLWDLALRAEDGGRVMSEAELAVALDNTLLLLRRKATPDQVQGALGGLAEAFENYGQQHLGGPSALQGDSIDWDAVQRLFLRFNELLMAGDYPQLAEQIVSLRSGLEDQPALLLSASAYRHFVVASYARRVMDEVVHQQQQLSKRLTRETAVKSLALAADQAALRDAMADLISQLSRAGIPDMGVFMTARAAMETAVAALTEGAPEGIAESQMQVTKSLEAAAERLSAFPSPVVPDSRGQYRDPLGRPMPPGF